MRTAQRFNHIGIEPGVSFEALAQIRAALDFVKTLENRPLAERTKAPREILKPRPVAAKAASKPGAIRRLDGSDYRLRSAGRRARFGRRHGVFPFVASVFASFAPRVSLCLLSYEIAPRRAIGAGFRFVFSPSFQSEELRRPFSLDSSQTNHA